MTAPEDGKKPEPAPHESGLRAARKERAAATKAAAKKAPPHNVTHINSAKSAAKTPAKKAAAKKAPAKKAPAKTVAAVPKAPAPRDADHPWYSRTSYTARPGQKLYEATGESGQIAVRSFPKVVTHAVSVAYVNYPGERAEYIRKGVIYSFYPDEESARKIADKLNKDPDHAVVVPVREYRGQGEK